MDNAHDPRSLVERLKWIADWSEPGIDLADAGTAREALDTIERLSYALACIANPDWKATVEDMREFATTTLKGLGYDAG